MCAFLEEVLTELVFIIPAAVFSVLEVSYIGGVNVTRRLQMNFKLILCWGAAWRGICHNTCTLSHTGRDPLDSLYKLGTGIGQSAFQLLNRYLEMESLYLVTVRFMLAGT